MLAEVHKEELSQISLTGVRALVLLGLLIETPCSLEEIRERFIKYGIMDPTHSDDIIRIDINTLRAAGCEISRADQKTDYKYKLIRHPFALNISTKEIALLKRTYNKIKESFNIDAYIKYDVLFRKLAECVSDEKVKQELFGISALKRYDISKILELQDDCKHERTLKIIYSSPASDRESEKDIVAHQIVCRNNKVYLYGFDKNLRKAVTLHFKRIKQILSRKKNNEKIEITSVKVKFKLKDFDSSGLHDNETIISGNFSDGFIIEGKYHNEFLAMQRILSFGENCTVISPDDFKETIIESLKKMRELYNG